MGSTVVTIPPSSFQPDQQQAYQGATYGWQEFFTALEKVLARID
jgi:hypothetical protein